MNGHHSVYIANQEEARSILGKIGSDPGSFPYMAPKAVHRCIKLKNISCAAANIIKQEMLSRGGEAAIAREAIIARSRTDVLLMGTIKQYELLIDKLKKQPLELAKLAAEVKNILDSLESGSRTLELANGRELEIGKKTLVMGILNVTPDSFSDGGKYIETDRAIAHAWEMIEQGADIIDIGGASSRPDSVMADQEEELKRVLPVVKNLSAQGITISVDTCRAGVARAALDNGAHIINDIGSLKLDPNMVPVISEKQAPVILMHNRLQINKGQAYEDIISDIVGELQDAAESLERLGLNRSKIMVDPGIGFGKSPGENLLIIKQLSAFKSMGFPVVVGISRKSFIGRTLDLDVDERLEGSLGLLAVSIMNGADMVRVHDVKESCRVAQIVDAVVRLNG
ncbi:dihydropteroate synthase [hydrocarbon metagenome]|uniref:dihydropteroate synthase n=1 Tax=hydrocarbon metagenome TaxID=938273 RepID=A0A0W8E8N7_9ZZZZ